jgi:hypothetical protein
MALAELTPIFGPIEICAWALDGIWKSAISDMAAAIRCLMRIMAITKQYVSMQLNGIHHIQRDNWNEEMYTLIEG